MAQPENVKTNPIRDRLGLVASFVGAVGMALAILALIWQSGATGFVIASAVVGAAGLILWVILTPQEAINLVTGRQVRYGTVTVLASVLLIAIVVTVYVLLQRAVITIDMTASGQFTLTRETLDVLSRVDEPIQITGFYSPNALPQREVDDQFFRLYSTETDDLIQRVYYDPQENPALAQAFGVQTEADVFISYLDEDGQVDLGTLRRVVRESSQERDVTSALLRLINTGEFRVAFEVGFTGADISPVSEGQQGYAAIVNGLEGNGVTTFRLDLRELAAAGGTIDRELVDAVVLLRTAEALPQAAVDVLAEFLQNGGSLFIAADATLQEGGFMTEDTPFNQFMWENYGLRMQDAVIVDALSSDTTELDLLSYATSDGSTITARLNDPSIPTSRARFRLARPVEVDPTPPVTNGFVIATSPQSYGERNLDRLLRSNEYDFDINEDIAGPLNVAAWARDEATNARIFMVGDSDFLTNEQILAPEGNSILFTDAIAWLTGFNERVIFTPQARVTNLPTIFIAPETLDQVALFVVVLIPALVLFAGFGVWFVRSRR